MRKLILSILAVAALAHCSTPKSMRTPAMKAFDFQGHRGARGLMPENTIPAMRTAIDLGVTTLELDVVISADKQVVVSHDAYFSDYITTTPDGRAITRAEGATLLLYRMPYDSIRRYDVGLKPHPLFPRQQKMAVPKPLLSELLDATEAYAAQKGTAIQYNVEIKSNPGYDDVRHPAPAEFAALVLGVLQQKKVLARTTIQSFDVRPLQYLHRHHPNVRLSYLVEKTTEPLAAQLEKLGFVPPVYSPEYSRLGPELVAEAHRRGMQVIPWTINNVADMQKLVAMGVDGIISDYPDLFKQLSLQR